MNHEKAIRKQRIRRRFRVRKKLRGTPERPRLSIHRSVKHIYCQVIDDSTGKTITAASSVEKDLKINNGGNCDAASTVGKAVAERAKAAGVKAVCLDRGSFRYQGRVAALANALREEGISV